MKQIVIIGHSSGIGEAISQQLGENHRVYGTFRSQKPENLHQNVSSHFVDIMEEEIDWSFLPESIDGLVYCPGAIQLKPFHRIKPEAFLQDYQLQVLGAIKSIQQCIPKLRKGNDPSVVLFSTVAVQNGFNFHSIVSASKGAIEGLTKALSAEYAPKIRFNCIAPSLTKTPLADNMVNTEDKIAANADRHPMKRIGKPEDIANMASFLLSNQSNWITGQVFHVDGGISTIK